MEAHELRILLLQIRGRVASEAERLHDQLREEIILAYKESTVARNHHIRTFERSFAGLNLYLLELDDQIKTLAGGNDKARKPPAPSQEPPEDRNG